jgi:hypothetical protein
MANLVISNLGFCRLRYENLNVLKYRRKVILGFSTTFQTNMISGLSILAQFFQWVLHLIFESKELSPKLCSQ